MMKTANTVVSVVAFAFASAPFAAEPTREAQSPPTTASAPAAAQSSDQQQPASATAPRQAGARQQAATPRANDRLDLDTTVVTGNRELPKVLYIVPWKKADLGDLPAQPFNTLLDEVLAPVDRDVFRREVTYYDAVSSGGNAAAEAAQSPARPSEK